MVFDPVTVMEYANTILALLNGPMTWILGLGAAAFVFTLIVSFMRGGSGR